MFSITRHWCWPCQNQQNLTASAASLHQLVWGKTKKKKRENRNYFTTTLRPACEASHQNTQSRDACWLCSLCIKPRQWQPPLSSRCLLPQLISLQHKKARTGAARPRRAPPRPRAGPRLTLVVRGVVLGLGHGGTCGTKDTIRLGSARLRLPQCSRSPLCRSPAQGAAGGARMEPDCAERHLPNPQRTESHRKRKTAQGSLGNGHRPHRKSLPEVRGAQQAPPAWRFRAATVPPRPLPRLPGPAAELLRL